MKKIISYSDFLKEDVSNNDFNNWFKGSKMVKSDGEPKPYYHFSDVYFTKFKDQSEEGYERKHSLTNKGIYFLPGIPEYKYGKNKYKVFLNIKNPFIIDNGRYISDVVNPLSGKNIEVEHINDDDIKFLTKKGYDGVVALYPSFQTVVFNSNQVWIDEINDKKLN
jgi:hypothetical protein